MNRYLLYASQAYSLAILRPLQQAVRERGGEVAWFFPNPEIGDAYLRAGERRLNSMTEVMKFAPQAVLVSGNVVPDFFPGIKVEVFHGFSVGKRDDSKGHFRIRGFFDLYCTQGPHTSAPFGHLAQDNGSFEVRETGWPKMDPLFAPGGDEEQKERPVVLLTSTFTPALSCAPVLFDEVKRLAATDRWEWLVTVHPKMDPQVVARYRGIQSANLRFVETDDIIPLLKRADVMISDTSSVVSEFLLQIKPVVTFRNRRPGPHLFDIQEVGQLEGAIEKALERPQGLMAEIERYANNIHPYRDGRSSHRVLDAVDDLVARGTGHLKRKPLNLWRRLKIRWEFKYFKG